jgi:Domain of unknown function (DUF4431)
MRLAIILVVGIYWAGAIESLAARSCMNDASDREVAEGKLSADQLHDAAGRPVQPYILNLPVPACLSSSIPDGQVGDTLEIQIFSSDPELQTSLSRFVGLSVLVRGRPFAAHTIHHHAPIVMDIHQIDSH